MAWGTQMIVPILIPYFAISFHGRPILLASKAVLAVPAAQRKRRNRKVVVYNVWTPSDVNVGL